MGFSFSNLLGPIAAATGVGALGTIGIGSALGLADSAGAVWSAKENARQAQANRDWQEDMASTAHQREVIDLRKAGLNPILSSGGKGAPVGGGATAAPAPNPASGGISSALKVFEVFADIAKTNAETLLTNAKTESEKVTPAKIAQETSSAKSVEDLNKELITTQVTVRELNTAMKQYNQMLTDLVEKQKITEELKNKLQRGDIQVQKAEIAKAKNLGQIDSGPAGVLFRYLDRIGQIIAPMVPRGHYSIR